MKIQRKVQAKTKTMTKMQAKIIRLKTLPKPQETLSQLSRKELTWKVI